MCISKKATLQAGRKIKKEQTLRGGKMYRPDLDQENMTDHPI